MDVTAIFVDVDAVFAVGTRQLRGNVLVFAGRDTRAGLTQDDRRAERIENRRNLHAGRTRTDNEQRFRRRLQRKGVCRRYREFAARYVKRAADAAGTDHDGVRAQNETRFAFERVPSTNRVVPARSKSVTPAARICSNRSIARALRQRLRALAPRGAHSRAQVARPDDAVAAELPRFAHESRRVCQRPNGNRAFVCRHASKRVARNQRGLSSSSAARSAAAVPAGPAPIATTSNCCAALTGRKLAGAQHVADADCKRVAVRNALRRVNVLDWIVVIDRHATASERPLQLKIPREKLRRIQA